MALRTSPPAFVDSHAGSDSTAYRHSDEMELPPPPDHASGTPSSVDRDWGGTGAFGAGIVIGALIGVGTALFLAPQTGRALRRQLRRGASRLRDRSDDAFEELRDELRLAARGKRRALRRRVRHVRYSAEDATDDLRRKAES